MSSSSSKKGQSKPKGSVRAKSGCYTCRIRRKKCDEQPNEEGNCQTCVRLRLQCLGFGTKRPEWMREGNNVAEMRQKIKGFLASNGMIKGHAASATIAAPSPPGDGEREDSPTQEESPTPTHPVASSSSSLPSYPSYPPGPPSSVSESGSRSSSSTVPPIATLAPPPTYHYQSTSSSGLPYALQQTGGQTSPYSIRSPITPGSNISHMSPPPHRGPQEFSSQGAGGQPVPHGHGNVAASSGQILGLSQGRPTGDRRTGQGSPTSSSSSGSDGKRSSNGRPRSSSHASCTNALGMSDMVPMSGKATRHLSSRYQQSISRNAHNDAYNKSSMMAGPSNLHLPPSHATPISVDRNTHDGQYLAVGFVSSSTASHLSSPSLASLSNNDSPRSNTGAPITPSDPHPHLMFPGPVHPSPHSHTSQIPNSPSYQPFDMTTMYSIQPDSDTPYFTGFEYLDPQTEPSPNIDYGNNINTDEWSNIPSLPSHPTPNSNYTWQNLSYTPPNVVKPEPVSPSVLVTSPDANDTQTSTSFPEWHHGPVRGTMGLGLDVGNTLNALNNNAAFSPLITSTSISSPGPNSGLLSVDTFNSSSAFNPWTSSVAIPSQQTQVNVHSGHYAHDRYGSAPQLSPDSSTPPIRNDPILGAPAPEYSQQANYMLTPVGQVMGARDVHGGMRNSGYEVFGPSTGVNPGHGNIQYTGIQGTQPQMTPLRNPPGANMTQAHDANGGAFGAHFNPSTYGRAPNPIGAGGYGYGGLGQHAVGAQGVNLLAPGQGQGYNTDAFGGAALMYETIEQNNSDEQPILQPPRVVPQTFNAAAYNLPRSVYSSFTNVREDQLEDEDDPTAQMSRMWYVPRGGAGNLVSDYDEQDAFGPFLYDDMYGPPSEARGLELCPAPSIGLPVPWLEAGRSDADLVKYYLEYVQPMQYFFAGPRVVDKIKELAMTHSVLRDAICAVASVHQRRKRQAPVRKPSQAYIAPADIPVAGSGEDDDGYRNKAEQQLSRLVHSASALAQKGTRLDSSTALAGLECVSIFLFEGGLGEWDKFLAFPCNWVESVLAQASETAARSGKELWQVIAETTEDDPLKKFVLRTTMWFEVLASVTQMRKPRFFEYYRVLFGPLAPSRFEEITDSGTNANFCVLNSNMSSQQERELQREKRFSMLEVMGCDNSTFLALAEITALSAWKEEKQQMGSLSAVELVRRGDDIRTRYLSRAPSVPSTERTRKGEHADNLETRRYYTASIFHAAANLYLDTVLSGDNPSVPEIADGVRATLEALESVPTEPPTLRSSVVRSVVFPICLAGCMMEVSDSAPFSFSALATSVMPSPSPSTSTLGKRSRSSTQSASSTGDYRETLLSILTTEALGAGNCGEVIKIIDEVWNERRAAKERQSAKRLRTGTRQMTTDERMYSNVPSEVAWREVLRKRGSQLLLV